MPGPAVTALWREGHDAVWMHGGAPGTPNVEVLARAQQEERAVVTFDKDFGELAFRLGAAATFGRGQDDRWVKNSRGETMSVPA